jgi:protein-L-isoaspartate(D-aspartate) O-methyltransferase
VPDEQVIGAIAQVPRDRFVPEESKDLAYEDIPLPIGLGQTISQPMIVAMMVRALELRRSDRVLEVGTGSGYQAAILAKLSDTVITVERIPSLAEAARERLASLGNDNVSVVLAEGSIGWKPEAPYDAIVVAAGAPTLLRGLMDQLATGGRLVIPVGSLESQQLMKATRSDDTFSVETLGPCRFIPLIGDGAWPESQAGGRDDD